MGSSCIFVRYLAAASLSPPKRKPPPDERPNRSSDKQTARAPVAFEVAGCKISSFKMKTDRTALFWGTIIGVSLVAVSSVLAFEFPHFRMPLTSTERETLLVSGFFFGILVAAYRKLWKAQGFWALLLAFLGVHTALYWLFIEGVAERLGGLRKDVFYGTVSGIEFVILALIVARLYHRGPNTRFL
jgi:hypothetical protein